MKAENKVTLVCDRPVDRLGTVALVDPDRLEELSRLKWRVQRGPHGNYALRHECVNDKWMPIYLHSQIHGPTLVGFTVDHKNLNTMDNRGSNLRQATRQQQQHNCGKHTGCSSEFKGVCFDKSRGKWMASVQHPLTRKRITIGRFDHTPSGEIEAASAYDHFASAHFGEFARLNFPAI